MFASRSLKQSSNKPQRHSLIYVLSKWQLYVLILPAIISVFIFHYIPIYGVIIAFKDFRATKGIWGSNWVGLKHFIRFVTYRDFWQIVGNTLRISILTLTTFPIPIILALMLNDVRNKRYKQTAQMITYAPHFVSTVVVCSMVIMFTNVSSGIINKAIVALGGTAIDFMTKTPYFAPVYVISGLWQNAGWNTIVYIAALAGVEPELYEAAYIDGASNFQITKNINLPSILPTVIIMLILNTGSVLSVGFEKVYLLQNPLNLPASRTISTYVYEMGIEGGQFSYSSAIGLFNNLVNVVIIIAVNKISKAVTDVGLW
jgi:putative aldouronate transport system permease protein